MELEDTSTDAAALLSGDAAAAAALASISSSAAAAAADTGQSVRNMKACAPLCTTLSFSRIIVLLCAVHTAVQVPRMFSLVLLHAWTPAAGLRVRSAGVACPPARASSTGATRATFVTVATPEPVALPPPLPVVRQADPLWLS